MSDSIDDIETALRAKFIAAVPAAVNNTAYENQPFDPKGKGIWFRFTYMPNEPVVATLGKFGKDSATGIAQIDINLPKGTGKTGLKEIEDALRSAFTAGERLVQASVNVIVMNSGRSGVGRMMDTHYRFIYTISFESHIKRN